MEMEDKDKKWIDNATYETLLRNRRFAPVGSPLFQGDTGDYYSKVMWEKRDKLSNEKRVQASKNACWYKGDNQMNAKVCLWCGKEKPEIEDKLCPECRKTLNLIKGISPTGTATGQRRR